MKLFSTPPVLSGKKNKKRKKLLKAQRKALKRADHPFESDKAADCRGVVLSNRAYLSVLSEVYSRDPLETGGIFFGNVKNAVWYVAEASDPGVYTLHTRAHHEMDNNYHNHIYPVLSRLYQHGLCGALAPPPRLARHVFKRRRPHKSQLCRGHRKRCGFDARQSRPHCAPDMLLPQ